MWKKQRGAISIFSYERCELDIEMIINNIKNILFKKSAILDNYCCFVSCHLYIHTGLKYIDVLSFVLNRANQRNSIMTHLFWAWLGKIVPHSANWPQSKFTLLEIYAVVGVLKCGVQNRTWNIRLTWPRERFLHYISCLNYVPNDSLKYWVILYRDIIYIIILVYEIWK